MSNEISKGHTYTITTSPENEHFLNYLVRTRVLPELEEREALQKRVAQGSVKRKLSREKEIDNILRFTGLKK